MGWIFKTPWWEQFLSRRHRHLRNHSFRSTFGISAPRKWVHFQSRRSIYRIRCHPTFSPLARVRRRRQILIRIIHASKCIAFVFFILFTGVYEISCIHFLSPRNWELFLNERRLNTREFFFFCNSKVVLMTARENSHFDSL